MGGEACRAVAAEPDLELAAAVDPKLAGIDLRQVIGDDAGGLQIGGDVADLAAAGVEVAVDFTVADSAVANLAWCAAHGVHAVVGTTGLDTAVVDDAGARFEAAGLGLVVAANFAIGAVLMMRFAELAAPFMDSVEIIELHHDAKRDAPSGTALVTASRIEGARRPSDHPWPADPTEDLVVEGARGATGPGGVHIHSVRLPGLVAHQEVVFGARGQSLSLRHDAYDRTSFMPGVLLAVRSVRGRPGLTRGLDPLLGF